MPVCMTWMMCTYVCLYVWMCVLVSHYLCVVLRDRHYLGVRMTDGKKSDNAGLGLGEFRSIPANQSPPPVPDRAPERRTGREWRGGRGEWRLQTLVGCCLDGWWENLFVSSLGLRLRPEFLNFISDCWAVNVTIALLRRPERSLQLDVEKVT